MPEPTWTAEPGGTASVTVLFVDVVASTATMTRIGDDAADQLRRRLFEIYRQAVASNGGVLVKTMGDGAMAVFTSSALQAVSAGVEMVRRAGELVPRSEVRVGIASGEASQEQGDWFGTPVVLASRLCDKAAPSQVLCSDGTRSLVGSRGEFGYRPQRPLRLKGFSNRVQAFAVTVEAVPRRGAASWMVGTGILLVLLLAAGIAVVVVSGDDVPATDIGDADDRVVWQRPDYDPRIEERECLDDESAGDATVECSTLLVPIDRSDPGGPQMRLALSRAPATDEIVSTPVVHFASDVQSPTSFATRSVANVVLLGLRGTAVSEPALTCPEVDESRPERLAMPSSEAKNVLEQDVDRCHQRLVSAGVDLAQYDPLDMADDLRDLAVALGVEQVDVVVRQASDSFLALAALRRHPGLIRSLTLFDPVPVGVTEASGRPQAAGEQFDLLIERCRATTALCGEPSLLEVVESLRVELDAEPRVVEGGSEQTGVSTPVLFDGDRLVKTLALALGDNAALPFIPRLVRDRDLTAAAGYLLSVIELAGFEPDVGTVLQQCVRSPELSTAQLDTEGRLATWGALADTGLPARCQRWGLEPLPEFERPVASEVPTFVLRGALGAPSVLDWHLALDGLSRRQEIVFANEAFVDNASGAGCGADLRRQFVVDPGAPLPIEACAARDEPIDFVE